MEINNPKYITSYEVNNPKYITFYIDKNFEFILTQIYKCYKKMLVDFKFIENNENTIKNRLYKDYLNNQNIRNELGLTNFLFRTETAIIDKNYKEKGYSDIEVIDLKGSMKSTEAFYIIECKRIKGDKTYNDKYINDGINRFINEKYPTHHKANGMIGFVVKAIDIDKNTNFFSDLKPHQFINNFKHSYISEHITTNSNKEIILYHLMLDFSDRINQNPK